MRGLVVEDVPFLIPEPKAEGGHEVRVPDVADQLDGPVFLEALLERQADDLERDPVPVRARGFPDFAEAAFAQEFE
jgi:hypothetical protein